MVRSASRSASSPSQPVPTAMTTVAVDAPETMRSASDAITDPWSMIARTRIVIGTPSCPLLCKVSTARPVRVSPVSDASVRRGNTASPTEIRASTVPPGPASTRYTITRSGREANVSVRKRTPSRRYVVDTVASAKSSDLMNSPVLRAGAKSIRTSGRGRFVPNDVGRPSRCCSASWCASSWRPSNNACRISVEVLPGARIDVGVGRAAGPGRRLRQLDPIRGRSVEHHPTEPTVPDRQRVEPTHGRGVIPEELIDVSGGLHPGTMGGVHHGHPCHHTAVRCSSIACWGCRVGMLRPRRSRVAPLINNCPSRASRNHSGARSCRTG